MNPYNLPQELIIALLVHYIVILLYDVFLFYVTIICVIVSLFLALEVGLRCCHL